MMNERIKELAIQAAGKGYQTFGTSDFDSLEKIEKFAELIVEECINMMEEQKDYYSKPGSYESREYYERCEAKADAYDDAASMIRYRLGVK